MNSSSLRRTALPAVAILTVGLTLAACGNNSSSGGASGGDTLSGGGATSQANAQTAWRAAYQKANGGTINYEEVGSGTGVTNFTSKAYSFAGSDAFLTDDQMTAAKSSCGSDVVEVPAYVSPIAVAFNVSGVKSLNLDAKTIADIFNGKITTWNDPEIANQNSGVKLPSDTIATVHRSDDSGTTNNFTDYLSKASGGAWTDAPSSTWPASLNGKGQGFDGTSGVVGALTSTPNSIGYADDSAVTAAKTLGVVSIKVGSDYNAPSADGCRPGARGLPGGPEPAGDLDGHRHRPDGHRQGRLPADAGVVPAGLPEVQRLQDRRHGQGLPDLRRVAGGSAGRGVYRRVCAADGEAVDEGHGDRLADLQLIEPRGYDGRPRDGRRTRSFRTRAIQEPS